MLRSLIHYLARILPAGCSSPSEDSSRKNLIGALVLVAIVTVTLIACIPTVVVAANDRQVQTQISELEKVKRIRGILSKQNFILSSGTNQRYCGDFLKALKAGDPKITFVKPILQTDNPESPGLRAYHECDKFDDYTGGRPENAYDSLDLLGQKRFALYRANIDSNLRDGLAEILYAEVDWGKSAGQQPGYYVVDLKKCLITDYIPVLQSERPNGSVLESYNALISYAGKSYVLDFKTFGTEKSRYTLDLFNFKINMRKNGDRLPCAWTSRRSSDPAD